MANIISYERPISPKAALVDLWRRFDQLSYGFGSPFDRTLALLRMMLPQMLPWDTEWRLVERLKFAH